MVSEDMQISGIEIVMEDKENPIVNLIENDGTKKELDYEIDDVESRKTRPLSDQLKNGAEQAAVGALHLFTVVTNLL